MFFKLFNIIFFIMFNICIALCGTLLYQKAVENEPFYKKKLEYNTRKIDDVHNTEDYLQSQKPIYEIHKISTQDTVITNYDKLLHYWLEFVQSSLIFLHNLKSEFLSSLLPKIKKI